VSHVAVLRAILLYSCEIVACDVVAMEKEQAFEIVSKIIFDDACQLIMGEILLMTLKRYFSILKW
jgi:hypothetical protein